MKQAPWHLLFGMQLLALPYLAYRVVLPFHGSGAYLTSATLACTAASVALGVLLAALVTRAAPALAASGTRRLGGVALVLGGLWVGSLAAWRDALLATLEPWGLHAATLVAILALVGPPGVALGWALSASRPATGSEGGTARAFDGVWRALGFAVAAVAVPWGILPAWGVDRTLVVAGGILVFLGGTASWPRRRFRVFGMLAVAGATLGVARALPPGPAPDPRGLVASAVTPAADLRILDHAGLRYLVRNGVTRAAVDPGNWDALDPEVAAAQLVRRLFDMAGAALFVGLPAPAIVADFAGSGWRCALVVEDDRVLDLAHTHLGLEVGDLAAHTAPARSFLRRDPRIWDLIFLEATDGVAPPFELCTREAAARLRARLRPAGMVCLRLQLPDWEHPLLQALTATLMESFREVWVLPTGNGPRQPGGLLLLAGETPLDVTTLRFPPLRRTDVRPHERWRRLVQEEAWRRRFVPRTAGAPVLRDATHSLLAAREAARDAAHVAMRQRFGHQPALYWSSDGRRDRGRTPAGDDRFYEVAALRARSARRACRTRDGNVRPRASSMSWDASTSRSRSTPVSTPMASNR